MRAMGVHDRSAPGVDTGGWGGRSGLRWRNRPYEPSPGGGGPVGGHSAGQCVGQFTGDRCAAGVSGCRSRRSHGRSAPDGARASPVRFPGPFSPAFRQGIPRCIQSDSVREGVLLLFPDGARQRLDRPVKVAGRQRPVGRVDQLVGASDWRVHVLRHDMPVSGDGLSPQERGYSECCSADTIGGRKYYWM